MPEWADQTSRLRHEIGFRRAFRPRLAVRIMFSLQTLSPSIFPDVIWRLTAGRSKASAGSIPNIARRETTSTSAGEFNRPDGLSHSAQPRSFGIIDVSPF